MTETKWCGPGNKAKNENDLGYFKITDACCRDHDLCGDSIKPLGSKHGLRNLSPFVRFSLSHTHLLDLIHVFSLPLFQVFFNFLDVFCYDPRLQITFFLFSLAHNFIIDGLPMEREPNNSIFQNVFRDLYRLNNHSFANHEFNVIPSRDFFYFFFDRVGNFIILRFYVPLFEESKTLRCYSSRIIGWLHFILNIGEC